LAISPLSSPLHNCFLSGGVGGGGVGGGRSVLCEGWRPTDGTPHRHPGTVTRGRERRQSVIYTFHRSYGVPDSMAYFLQVSKHAGSNSLPLHAQVSQKTSINLMVYFPARLTGCQILRLFISTGLKGCRFFKP
jgi:hypothetical protein